jgi:uncharacterized ParB-like nuclease family protein
MAPFRKAYADAKRKGISATTVASTGRYPGGKFPPITVAIDADGTAHLRDGRHRYTAAREAGAKKILANVIVYGPRGGIVRQEQRVLKLAK